MSANSWTYEAFISYRHNDRDAKIAEAISKITEGYGIPTKDLREQIGKKKVGKLFRDKDELPFGGNLNASIKTAIGQSAFFIMVCCPEYSDPDHWCIYELEEFLKTHDADHVIVVVSDGVVGEVLPEILRRSEDGGRPIEPFAIDLSGLSSPEQIKKLRSERLRLLAGLLQVNYDDLQRREHKRKIRRRWAVMTPIFAGITAFAVTVSFLALRINQERISAQNHRMLLLEESSIHAVAQGDRLAGMRYALDAVSVYRDLFPNGDPEAEEHLRRTLENAVYSGEFQLLAPLQNQNRTFGAMVFSPDDRYILGCIGSVNAVLFDADTGAQIASLSRTRNYMDNSLTAIGFSPSGDYFFTVFGSYSSQIIIWKTGETPVEVASLDVDENFVGAGFLSDSLLMAGRYSGLPSERYLVWDFAADTVRDSTDAEGERMAEFWAQSANGSVMGEPLVSPDGSLHLVGDLVENRVRVLEVSSGALVGEIRGVSVPAAVSHDGNRVIAGDLQGFCGLYSTMASATSVTEAVFEEEIYETPSYYETESGENLFLQGMHSYDAALYPGAQLYMLNEPSGRFCAMVYPDGFVEIWDLEQSRELASYSMMEHIGRVSKAYMTSEYLVTCGQDGRLMVFDLHAGVLKHGLSVEDGIVTANKSPNDVYVAVLGRSMRTVYVIDIRTGYRIYILEAEPEAIFDAASVGFSTDGTRAVAVQTDGRAKIGPILENTEDLVALAEEMSGVKP